MEDSKKLKDTFYEFTLSGLKVLAFEQYGAGSSVRKYLADMGAVVVLR